MEAFEKQRVAYHDQHHAGGKQFGFEGDNTMVFPIPDQVAKPRVVEQVLV
jgi:hypothetical protein